MTDIPLTLDYPFLKEQGIAYIQQLAGKKWTDYGDHDPGITILEVLAFAIIDLEHRTNFYIEDIWANNPDAIDQVDEKPFYRAEEILPCNPLTKWDFLKIVLDVPGVKDANIFLSNAPKDIKGGYKIYVDVEERIRNLSQEEEVLTVVKQRLAAQRNLCEDFFVIQNMQTILISIKTTFELSYCLSYEEGESIVAHILYDFQEFISPKIPFYSISQLLDKGKTIDQIFTGPLLTQGFIDEEDLIYLKNKTSIYTVEFLEKVTNIAGIKNVLNCEIIIMDDEATSTTTITLPVLPDRSFVLSIPNSEIILTYNSVPVKLDWDKILNLLENMKGRGTLTKAYLQEEEVFVLEGQYRHLRDYVSIQQDFPLLYNVGHEGCTPSETVDKHAKAKQLKSYLLFFDQLFANYLGQLSNIKHAMAIYSDAWDRPDGHLPLDVPRMDSIIKPLTSKNDPGNDLEFIVQKKYLDIKNIIGSIPHADKSVMQDPTKKEYFDYINKILESDIRSLDKRSRMLDHLLAYFAEKFTTYSLDLYPKCEEERLTCLNRNKALFLKDYIDISKNRSRAAYIAMQGGEHIWQSYIPSGFTRRLYRNLGIKHLDKHFAHRIIKNNLYLDKKIAQNSFESFLGKNHQIEYPDLFMFKGAYENIQSLVMAYGIHEEYYSITKNHAGIYRIMLYVDKSKQHTIELISGSQGFTSIEEAEQAMQQSVVFFRSLNEQCEGFHLIEHILLRNEDTLATDQDPYSFIMTIILPAWPARFQEDAFRHSVEKMVIAESPAHIFTNILWLSFDDMETFEKAYHSWMQLRTNPQSIKMEINAAAKILMEFIESHISKTACAYA